MEERGEARAVNTEVFENRFALRAFTRATVLPPREVKIKTERESEREKSLHAFTRATIRCNSRPLHRPFFSTRRDRPDLDVDRSIEQ